MRLPRIRTKPGAPAAKTFVNIVATAEPTMNVSRLPPLCAEGAHGEAMFNVSTMSPQSSNGRMFKEEAARWILQGHRDAEADAYVDDSHAKFGSCIADGDLLELLGVKGR